MRQRSTGAVDPSGSGTKQGTVMTPPGTQQMRPAPRHIAIIMDGNGRWAAGRGLPRLEGHRHGVEAVRRTIRAAGDFKIPFLTLYSFSSENWSRPAAEVSGLMLLLKRFIRQDLAELHRNGIRLKMIGSPDGVEPEIIKLIQDAEALTVNNQAMTLQVAFNYGSRGEIVRAVQTLGERIRAGELEPGDITEQHISQALDTSSVPDPDLLIRTSGEQRLSNFLLWQCAYTEFVFVPVYWPDFNKDVLAAALDEYHARERRFGGTTASISLAECQKT